MPSGREARGAGGRGLDLGGNYGGRGGYRSVLPPALYGHQPNCDYTNHTTTYLHRFQPEPQYHARDQASNNYNNGFENSSNASSQPPVYLNTDHHNCQQCRGQDDSTNHSSQSCFQYSNDVNLQGHGEYMRQNSAGHRREDSPIQNHIVQRKEDSSIRNPRVKRRELSSSQNPRAQKRELGSSQNYRREDSSSRNYRREDSCSRNYRAQRRDLSSSRNYRREDSSSRNYRREDSSSRNSTAQRRELSSSRNYRRERSSSRNPRAQRKEDNSVCQRDNMVNSGENTFKQMIVNNSRYKSTPTIQVIPYHSQTSYEQPAASLFAKKQEDKKDVRLGQKGEGDGYEFGSSTSIHREGAAHFERRNSACFERRSSTSSQSSSSKMGAHDQQRASRVNVYDRQMASPGAFSDKHSKEKQSHLNTAQLRKNSTGVVRGSQKEEVKHDLAHAKLKTKYAGEDISLRCDYKQKLSSAESQVNESSDTSPEYRQLERSIFQFGVRNSVKPMPDCVVCMYPAESFSELYQLEACGHNYCYTCLEAHMKVQDMSFPILCIQDDCRKPLVWKDINFCIKKQWVVEKTLMEKSVSTASEMSGRRRSSGRHQRGRSRHRGRHMFTQEDREMFVSSPDLCQRGDMPKNILSEEAQNRQKRESVTSLTSGSSGYVGDTFHHNKKQSEKNFRKRRPRFQKKNKHEEMKQSDYKPEHDDKQVMPSNDFIKATLEILYDFTDAVSLKKVIIEHVQKLEETFQFHFVSNPIFCTDKLWTCVIEVQAASNGQGKNLINNLCVKLRKSLKTKVTYFFCENCVSPRKSNRSRAEEILAAKEYFPESTQEEKNKKVPGNRMSESRSQSCGADLEAAFAGRCDLITERVNLAGTQMGDNSKKIPTKILVHVDGANPDKQNIRELLSQIIENKRLSYALTSESLYTGTSTAVCELMVNSKQAAKEVVKQLKSCNLKGCRFYCQPSTARTSSGADVSSKSECMKVAVEEAVTEITRKAEKILEAHQEKIEKLEKALEVMQSATDDEEDDDDKIEELALIEKLAEILKQKSEFCARRDTLVENVKKLDLVTMTVKHLTDLQQSFGVECERLKSALPIYARRGDIVRTVSENQVSVILGETGSGKSTQMAQYIYEAGLAGNGLIICTQPRKVAAITLAERVSKEMAEKPGNLVGYKTGMQKKLSPKTKIIFATDHSLLNDCLADRTLSRYTCIIVDEAHERSIYTDLLLGMIKVCLPQRPDLKVVITSATIDPEIFINYFKCNPELRVSGRTFPVEVSYSEMDKPQEFDDYETKAVQMAIDVHNKQGPGDILVFLTSPVEIMRCCEEFKKRLASKKNFQCFPLHGQLPPDEQRKVFEHLQPGVRKVVFATNCAETSITIDGIKYVIDTGVAKEKRYDSKRNICSLGTFVISKSSADQRKGRAGRTSSGKCFRLYSKEGYQSMNTSTEPEILKVPLAQSVLKLSELGVDIKNYEFIQPPSSDAVDLALKSLTELGALSPEGITDIGRWIAKLPLDPKEGFLIYEGNKKKLLYDSVVVAALITNGSNLFYRGLTESEAQTSAATRSQYSSGYGDVFTGLKIYKIWIQLPKNEQSKWCTANGVNYKVLSFIRELVKDVITVIKKELITKEGPEEDEKRFSSFSLDESAMDTLRKILFYANLPSICHYLGHARAGYHALVPDRQVHLHPSSSLLSRNSQPEWVIYAEFTKTSRDFIKGVTVISEDWIEEAIRDGKLCLDISAAKQRRTELVHREAVGLSAFYKLVGPRFAHLRVWEDKLSNAGMKAVVVEAERDFGTFDIYSCSPMDQGIKDQLTREKNEVIQVLQEEEVEMEILKKVRDPTGVRVSLGQGASVKSVLMPYQSNKVLIKKSDHNTTEEILKAKFGKYGTIKECIRFKALDPWGFIRYDSCTEAQAAVDGTRNDKENIAVLKLDKQQKPAGNKFEARLCWCRRPSTGAIIKCPPVEKAGLTGRHLHFPHGSSEIKVSKRGDDLVSFNVGNVTEAEIQKQVMDILEYTDHSRQNILVSIMRKKVPMPSQEDLNEMKNTIVDSFSRYVSKDKFSLHMMPVKPGTVNYIAFLHFNSAVDGFQACENLRDLCVGGTPVEISPKLKTTVQVSKSIMKVCENRFKEIARDLREYKNTDIIIRPLKHGDSVIEINSDTVEHILEARELLQKELEGYILDCKTDGIRKNLLKQQSRDFLRRLEKKFEALIIVNQRRDQVQIFGDEPNVSKILYEINQYLGRLTEGKHVELCLTGQNRAPGLMKKLIQKYGSSFDALVNEFGLSDVTVNFRQQKLSILGPSESVDKALSCISELESSIPRLGIQNVIKPMPDCTVCMCPIESFSELYRLEACGHSYCFTCLEAHMKVQDKSFPITCAQDGCRAPLVWKDIKFCITKQWAIEKQLMEKSVCAFVSANLQKYRFCLTPECPIIYQATEKEEGCEFTCPACFVSLCTSCHAQFHDGLTCKQRSSETEADRKLKEWLKQDPINRKLCPGCKVPVEKIDGCNKMVCLSCHTYFCWVCLEVCEDEQKCYAHLAKTHGGFS